MRCAGVCLLALLASCRSDPEITAVRIVATYGEPRFDQFAFRLDVESASRGPFKVPTPPDEALHSPQDLVVYGPDAWAGKTATCQVFGLRSGDSIAVSVPTSVTVEFHRVVTCTASLDGTPDGAALDAPPFPLDAPAEPDAAAPDAPADTAPPPTDLAVDP
jgi:hypothetical protein